MAGIINVTGAQLPKGAQIMAIPVKPGSTTAYIVTKNPQGVPSNVTKGDVSNGQVGQRQQIVTVIPPQQLSQATLQQHTRVVTTSGSGATLQGVSSPRSAIFHRSPATPGSASASPLVASAGVPVSTQGGAVWTGLGNGNGTPRGIKRTHDSLFDEDEAVDLYGRRLAVKKEKAGGKGLRHFSMKVCEKVQKKGKTTYNEVADELVNEFASADVSSPTDQAYDQKNIRRRVYDALNVLMAMNIIAKEKKEILWLGLPTNSAQECEKLEAEKLQRIDKIRKMMNQLNELILQQIAFKSLVERNKEREAQGVPRPKENFAIKLPFIIINTNKKTVIDCSISSDKSEYLFNFDNMFEIHDDIECLKRMGLDFGLEQGQCSPENLEKAIGMVPDAFKKYVLEIAEGRDLSTWVPNLPSDSLSGRNQEDQEVAAAMVGYSQGSILSSQGSSQGRQHVLSSAMSSQSSSTTRGSATSDDQEDVDEDDFLLEEDSSDVHSPSSNL